jgi:hypothetical protein
LHARSRPPIIEEHTTDQHGDVVDVVVDVFVVVLVEVVVVLVEVVVFVVEEKSVSEATAESAGIGCVPMSFAVQTMMYFFMCVKTVGIITSLVPKGTAEPIATAEEMSWTLSVSLIT